MRVYISSIPEELEPHQAAACAAAHDLGFEPVLRDPAAGRGLDPVRACARQVAAADLVLAIVGWRRGRVPPPELGGDGFHHWTWWETKSAFDHGKPVVVLMAGESWRPQLREQEPRARAVMQDFRGELGRLASLFDDEPADGSTALRGFRDLVRRKLLDAQRDLGEKSTAGDEVRLRRWPPPELPERPYPLLLPYTHPDLMAGRDRELDELCRTFTLPVAIVGLYAPAGTGKSSLVTAGLVPRLRAEGRPVAFDRHSTEPGLAGRLIADLLDAGDESVLKLDDEDHGRFVELLLAARKLAGSPPVLVLDQFEDLFRRPEGRRVRAMAGVLLAASVQRQPGLEGPLCHWLLAYRQEIHGEIFEWLEDALREARSLDLAGAEALPHELSGAERFHSRVLAPLGTPAAGSDDPVSEATRVFQAAIETPLALRTAAGVARFPWRFAGDDAARLARAFGEARVAQPRSPLVPELQVVLAHLLAQVPAPPEGGTAVVRVPDEPGEMIGQALKEHLRRALADAFPGSGEEARFGRARALLALRELADARGQCGEGVVAETLARAISRQGREVLEKLATPQARLVVSEQQAGEWIYVLSHDRMAEVVVRLVDEEEGHANLGVDAELLRLRRLVALKSEFFAAGEVEQAMAVPARSFRRIEKQAAALLWGEERHRWWAACRARRQTKRRTARWRIFAALIVLTVLVFGGIWVDRRAEMRTLLDQVANGKPEAAFTALDALLVQWKSNPEELREKLRQRQKPLDVLERGIGGIPTGARRETAVLAVAELSLPLIVDDAPEDSVRIATVVWALDFFAPRSDRTMELRNKALEQLRQKYPPPPLPGPGNPDWADIPAGTVLIGSGSGVGPADDFMLGKRPMQQVPISTFRIMTHEVTNIEYRRLFPNHSVEEKDDLPAGGMTWYEAYTYAAWIGGRLPTEAEWEYAARAGCAYAYCKRNGTKARFDEVAWYFANAVTNAVTGESAPRVVGQLAPNPWGLFDVYGNVWEMTSDWRTAPLGENQGDPSPLTVSADDLRVVRGGSAWNAERGLIFARGLIEPEKPNPRIGMRVVLIEPAQSD